MKISYLAATALIIASLFLSGCDKDAVHITSNQPMEHVGYEAIYTMSSFDSISISWPQIPGAVKYEFEISADSTSADKFHNNYHTFSDSNNLNFPVVTSGTIYWWRVRAITASGKTDWVVSNFKSYELPVNITTHW